MLRPRHIALGQEKQAFQADQEQIIRSVPPCFKSKQILPAINTAMNVARSANIQGGSVLNPYVIPEDVASQIRNAMDRAYYTLDYWFKRLSTENPEKEYCVGKTDGQSSSDRQQIINAIVEPIITLSRYDAASKTKQAAVNQLVIDLNPINYIPSIPGLPGNPLTQWATIVGVAAAAYLFLSLRRR